MASLSENLLDRILSCDFLAQDNEELVAVVAGVPARELADLLSGFLSSGNSEVVSGTCLLIQTFILGGVPQHDVVREFRETYHDSAVVDALERLVWSDNITIRSTGILTLGKTGCTRSVPVLKEALVRVRDTDPLLLPQLFGEIHWLEKQPDWSLLDSMMSSASYPARWAALGSLSSILHDYRDHESDVVRVKWRCYEQLRSDENEFVRDEALFKYEELEFEQLLPTLSRLEKRRLRGELEKRRPVSFDHVEMRFLSYLSMRRASTYTVAELRDFVEANMHTFTDDELRKSIESRHSDD
jgi:hypothetical protein